MADALDRLGHNFAAFNKDLKRESKKVSRNQFRLMMMKIGMDALCGLVMRTPVRTGRARGGWQTTINVPTDDEIERLDKNGSATIADGMRVLEQMQREGIALAVFFSNNVEYIVSLEEGGSAQAPDGMVAVTMAEIRTMFS